MGVCDSEGIGEFKVNYSKSFKHISRDTVRYLIQKDQNLDVLSACKHFNKDEIIVGHFRGDFEWLRDESALGQNKFDQARALFSRRKEWLLGIEAQFYPLGYIPSLDKLEVKVHKTWQSASTSEYIISRT